MPKTSEHAALGHEDLAIRNVLRQIEVDVEDGRRIRVLPAELAAAMLANICHAEKCDEQIEGGVAL